MKLDVLVANRWWRTPVTIVCVLSAARRGDRRA